jgi:hypothetical protein
VTAGVEINGKRLHAFGCRQGALVEGLKDGELWVVVSQDCDIVAASGTETHVEVIRAQWTADRAEISKARKGNSTRAFLMVEDGSRALLVDPRKRQLVEKAHLEGTTFKAVLPEHLRGRFARWIASRYDRPAIPDETVKAIHKPLVKAIDALAKRPGVVGPLLDQIDEIRFIAGAEAPLVVDFLVMTPDEDEFTAEQEADIAAWLETALVVLNGPVQEIHVDFRGPRSVSLHDYLATTPLQLDHYTAASETIAANG